MGGQELISCLEGREGIGVEIEIWFLAADVGDCHCDVCDVCVAEISSWPAGGWFDAERIVPGLGTTCWWIEELEGGDDWASRNVGGIPRGDSLHWCRHHRFKTANKQWTGDKRVCRKQSSAAITWRGKKSLTQFQWVDLLDMAGLRFKRVWTGVGMMG